MNNLHGRFLKLNQTRTVLCLMAVGCALLAIGVLALHASPRAVGATARTLSRVGERVNSQHLLLKSPAAGEDSALYTYTFGVVDFPRSQIGAVYGINDSGRIVGGYNNTNLEAFSADNGFELKGNTFSRIDYPGAVQSELFGLNKSGQVVGAFIDTSNVYHGYKLAGGTYTQLDYPGANGLTVALGINSSGEIVGVYDDPTTGNATGFVLNGGTYTSIAVPGAVYTYTEGINKFGVVAGYYFDAAGNSHGFTWDKGTITTLDYGNGYPNTYLAGIDDAGVIVGGYGSNLTINSVLYPWEHGFLYSGGIFSTFDAPFGDVQVTQPWGMNNKGEVVGGYVDSQGMTYGFYLKAQ